MEQCFFQMEAERNKGNKTSLVKGHRQRMDPLHYLARLAQRLPSTVQVLISVDYVALTRECNKLLKLMRVMVNRACDNPFPIVPKLYSYEIAHPTMVLAVLSEPLQEEKFGGLIDIDAGMVVQARSDSMLQAAREVLLKYLQTKQKKQQTSSARCFS